MAVGGRKETYGRARGDREVGPSLDLESSRVMRFRWGPLLRRRNMWTRFRIAIALEVVRRQGKWGPFMTK